MKTEKHNNRETTMSKETKALEIIRNTHGQETDGMSVEQFRGLSDAVTFYCKAFDAETAARLVCEEMFVS
jgi:hypothetical protein